MTDIKSVRLQVPMTPEMLAVLRERAVALGFNSAPAYIRYWASQEFVPMSAHELQLNEPCKIALLYCELTLARERSLPETAHQALDCISRQLRKRANRLNRRYKDKENR